MAKERGESAKPARQYLSPEYVSQAMCDEACRNIRDLSSPRILVLAILGGPSSLGRQGERFDVRCLLKDPGDA